MKSFWSIKNKLLVFALSISLVPIFVITPVYYLSARKELKRQINEEMIAVAESKKLHVEAFLNAIRVRIADFSSDGYIRNNLDKINHEGLLKQGKVVNLNKYLKNSKLLLDSDIAAITILDNAGMVVASTTESIIGKDFSDCEEYEYVIDKGINKIFIHCPHFSEYLGQNAIVVAAPITSMKGSETIGIIINVYKYDIINYITSNRKGMGESGEIVLGLRDGDNVRFLNSLRYAPDEVLTLKVPWDAKTAEPMRLALKGHSGTIIGPDYRDNIVIAAYQHIPSMGWGLVAKMDRAEAFEPLRLLGIIALALGGTSSLAVVAICIMFAVKASRSINELTDATEKFAGGDLNYRIKVTQNDEIGTLGRSFNDMAGKLSSEITEHKQAEDKLCVQNSYLRLLQVAAVAANEAVDVKDAFQPVLEEICCYTGWEIGHAYVISKDDPNLLEPTSVWWLKDRKHFKEFCDVSNKIKFAKGIGLPGRVLANRKPHWIVDVTKDKNFLRTKIVSDLNIKSGIAFPVMTGNRVVSVLEFFTTEVVKPDQQFMEIIAAVGTQLGRAVERKQAEEMLLKSEERYRSLIDDVLDTSNVGVVILDSKFQVIWINKAMESYFCLKRDEVIMKENGQLIKNKICHILEDGEQFKERVLSTYDDNTYVENFICHVLPGDGREERWLEHWSRPIVSGLYAGGRVENYTDITTKKLAENKLAAINRELEAFCYSVSHDLRAPLRSIEGFSKALEEDYAEGLDSQGKDYFQRIQRSSRHMSQLIDDLLNLSRITRSDMNYKMVDMSAMAKEITTVLRSKQPERQVELVIPKKIKAKGDERLLHVALENLLGNAWKFTGKHPRSRIEFGVTHNNGKEVYFVRDDGAGFDMSYVDKLFTAFQRLHDIKEFEGTGVGLATVQRIIHRHGGRIWAEGEVEHGATFYFTLQKFRD